MKESRRDRQRAATVREISETARRILVEHGADAVTLRAIAREMGMTAPALYRYFGSHEELLRHLVGDLYTEVTASLHAAMAGLDGDMGAKFLAVSRDFRRWSLAHPKEYALLFGAPVRAIAGHDESRVDFAEESARLFGRTFLTLFIRLWAVAPFPIPDEDGIDPVLLPQLRRYRDEVLDVELPLGVILGFLRCWVRLLGSVSLEVFGHLEFALDDAGPMFEMTLAELTAPLGLTYTPPE